jgi:hypothetical protein
LDAVEGLLVDQGGVEAVVVDLASERDFAEVVGVA